MKVFGMQKLFLKMNSSCKDNHVIERSVVRSGRRIIICQTYGKITRPIGEEPCELSKHSWRDYMYKIIKFAASLILKSQAFE